MGAAASHISDRQRAPFLRPVIRLSISSPASSHPPVHPACVLPSCKTLLNPKQLHCFLSLSKSLSSVPSPFPFKLGMVVWILRNEASGQARDAPGPLSDDLCRSANTGACVCHQSCPLSSPYRSHHARTIDTPNLQSERMGEGRGSA